MPNKLSRLSLMNALKEIVSFINEYNLTGKKLLVGFSGGPDSYALVVHLLKVKSDFNLTLELAHIDHGYRKESKEQAKWLQKWAQEKDLPFHLQTLKNNPESNLEDYFRTMRLSFFKSIYDEKGFDGLILAHQRDDVEETTFKRLFEGASLSKLASIAPYSKLNQMNIYRPLLTLSKKEIVNSVESCPPLPITDPTNFDGSNLRSRLRTKIFPTLEEGLGKKIRSSLYHLSLQSSLLKGYLEEKVSSLYKVSSDGAKIKVSFSNQKVHPVEMHFILKKICSEHNIMLSRSQLSTAQKLLSGSSGGKKILTSQATLVFSPKSLEIFKVN